MNLCDLSKVYYSGQLYHLAVQTQCFLTNVLSYLPCDKHKFIWVQRPCYFHSTQSMSNGQVLRSPLLLFKH